MKNVLWLVLMIATPATAEPAVVLTLPVPQELVVFVEAKTGVKLPEGQNIEVVENDNPIFTSIEARREGASGAEIGGVIYLPIRSAVHMSEPQMQALIVHELVHVVQTIRDDPLLCAGKREQEAYAMQNLYLREHSLPTIINEAILPMIEACGNSHS